MSVAYLTAKRTVDDRALNRRVLSSFSEALADPTDETRVLEVGAGTGTMLARLAEWELLPGRASYRLVDREPAHVDAARENVPEWLAALGYRVTWDDGTMVAERDDQRLRVRFAVADALKLEEDADTDTVTDTDLDAVVAGAFLDLVPLPEGLWRLAEHLDGGVLYAPVTFDGLTAMLPADDADGDIFDAYHRHMAVRTQPGRPDAGRAALSAVPEAGGRVLDVGGSDWVIRPVDGRYPADEALVLEHLLSTVVDAVSSLDGAVPADVLERWEKRRRRQLSAGELTFLAHNLDVLVRF